MDACSCKFWLVSLSQFQGQFHRIFPLPSLIIPFYYYLSPKLICRVECGCDNCDIADTYNGNEPSHAADDDQLLRVIAYEDVSEYLFSLYSKEAHWSLISQFIDFYGGRMAQWYILLHT